MRPDPNDAKQKEPAGIGGVPLVELKTLRAPDEKLSRDRLVADIADAGVLNPDSATCLRLEHAFFTGMVTASPEGSYNAVDLSNRADAWLDSLSSDELAAVERARGSREMERDFVVTTLLAVHNTIKPT